MADHFDNYLRKMELELTAIKTAHERGLGVVDFYRKTASTTVTTNERLATITVVAEFSELARVPAMTQLQMRVTGDGEIASKSFSDSGGVATWVYYARLGGGTVTATVDVVAISSGAMDSLTVTAVGGEG